MIIRRLEKLLESEYDIRSEGWNSRRLLLAKDGMGFSMHDTIIEKGAHLEMHYKHHLESVYCIEGQGTIQDLQNDVIHEIHPGTLYALDQHDKHILKAKTQMRMVCVFNPPVQGNEKHGPDGAYPPPATDS